MTAFGDTIGDRRIHGTILMAPRDARIGTVLELPVEALTERKS
jgi:hypothetical protein